MAQPQYHRARAVSLVPTERQLEVLAVLARLIADANGVCPTNAEIGLALGIRGEVARDHLRKLEALGLVACRYGVPRSTVLTPKGKKAIKA